MNIKKTFKFTLSLAPLLFLFGCLFEKKITIFAPNDDYSCFRAPALLSLYNGELLAFSEARSHKLGCKEFGDSDIVMRRSFNGGRTWGPIQKVADFGEHSAGFPTPVVDNLDPRYPEGRIFLFYNTSRLDDQKLKEGVAPREFWYIRSEDSGKSWSGPENITAQVSRPYSPDLNMEYIHSEDWRKNTLQSGHGIQMLKMPYRGRMVVCSSFWDPKEKVYRSATFFSDDHGQKWEVGTQTSSGPKDCAIVELENGNLLMSANNPKSNLRAHLQSDNGGVTWGEIEPKENSSERDQIKGLIGHNIQGKDSKRILIAAHSTRIKENNNLTVNFSFDQGITFGKVYSIPEEKVGHSDLAFIPFGEKIGVLFESKEDLKGHSINFTTFPMK